WVFLNRSFLPSPLVGEWLRSLRNAAIYIVVFSLLPGISAAGHFGGAVAGLLAGAALTKLRHGKGVVRLLGAIGLLALPLAGAAAILIGQAVDPRWGEIFLFVDKIRALKQIQGADNRRSNNHYPGKAAVFQVDSNLSQQKGIYLPHSKHKSRA